MMNLNSSNSKNAPSAINASIAKFFRNYAARAPALPPGLPSNTPPVYLWRGTHGKFARDLRERGSTADGGYISLSTSFMVARNFRSGHGIIMRIRRDSIPIGTPWVWYDTRKIRSSISAEREVLLPPGKIVLVNPIYGSAYGRGSIDPAFITKAYMLWYHTYRGVPGIELPTGWKVTGECILVPSKRASIAEIAQAFEYILRACRKHHRFECKTWSQERIAHQLEVLLLLENVDFRIEHIPLPSQRAGVWDAIYIPNVRSGMVRRFGKHPPLNSNNVSYESRGGNGT